MSAAVRPDPYAPQGIWRALESAAAGLLAILWILPLAYAVWAAFHPAEFTTRFYLFAPLTLENFERAWVAAPFARYFLNTFILVTLILVCQLVLCTLAAYAFARYDFIGSNVAFALVLAQLMIMPDVLIVENYRTMSNMGIIDTIPAIALPYVASAFGIFLLRQTFKTVPKELDDAARVEGAITVAGAAQGLRPARQADLRRLRARVGQLPLEQFSLAADRDQLGRGAPAHRRPAGVRLERSGHRLGDHLRRHADDVRAAADRLPAVPAPVRAEFHARGDSLTSRHEIFSRNSY